MGAFSKDLIQGKRGEDIVRDILFSYGLEVEDISGKPQFYYTGDLRVLSATGEYFIEVKNDTRIHETHNLLLEDSVYYKNIGEFADGNMYCDSDIYVVVSEPARIAYFFDFAVLKKHYKQGEFVEIDHPTQTTYGYLAPIGLTKQWGAYLGKVEF